MSPRIVDGLPELKSLVGQEVGVSDWFEVSQSLIDQFAEVTNDKQWIHVDPQRAKIESPYKTTIAHGFLTLSLVSQLQRQAVQIKGEHSRVINYGFNKVRFPAAVRAGSRIRLHTVLNAVEEIEGGAQCTWDLSLEIEGEPKPALVAQWLGRLYR